MYFSLFVGALCWPLFWCAILYVLSSDEIILTRKRELVALHLLSFGCLVTVNVLWVFPRVPWVDLQFVIVVFPDHTYLLFECLYMIPLLSIIHCLKIQSKKN